MKILVATGNPHKFKELVHILPATLKNGTQVKYLSLADFDNLELPPETGNSLEANAEQKAVFAARATGLPALSDDTGLEVDALHGQPGVYTARYAGEHADAAQTFQIENLHQALCFVMPPRRDGDPRSSLV